MDKIRWKRWKVYAGWIAAAEGAGALSGLISRQGMKLYNDTVAKPPLSPPPAVFPAVWTVLYALMGIGMARVWLTPPSAARNECRRIFLLQLAFNFCWSLLFFNFQIYGFALLWLAVLWGLILWMLLSFRRLDAPAGRLQLPYLLWVAFAAYLNLGVWLLNR